MIHEHCGENTQRPIPGSVTSASDYVGPRRLALSVLRSQYLALSLSLSLSLSPFRITRQARKRDAASAVLVVSYGLAYGVWLALGNERCGGVIRSCAFSYESVKREDTGCIVTKRKCSEDSTSSQATEKGDRESERASRREREESRAEQKGILDADRSVAAAPRFAPCDRSKTSLHGIGEEVRKLARRPCAWWCVRSFISRENEICRCVAWRGVAVAVAREPAN